MLPIRNISYLSPMCCNFLRNMHKQSQNWSRVQYPLKVEVHVQTEEIERCVQKRYERYIYHALSQKSLCELDHIM